MVGRVIEGKFFDVTVARKGQMKYLMVQAETAEEAAKVAGEFGMIENLRLGAYQTLILKEENKG